MRLDYYCLLDCTNNKGCQLDAKTLKRLDRFTDKTEGSDFTVHMDLDIVEILIGEHIQFEFKNGVLLARASFHEKEPLSPDQLAELSDYVIGQFSDGYGEDPLEISKWAKRYHISFADDVDGRHRVEAKTPKPKKKKRHADTKTRKFHGAVKAGDLFGVRQYVEAGNDINAVPKQLETFVTEMTALGWAANRGHIEIAKYLLANGADPNVRGKDAKGQTDGPAIFYANPDIAELLLEAGADPNAKNGDGLTRLEEIAKDLEWHETCYDPEGFMAEFDREDIQALKQKLIALTKLFAKYE